MIKNAVILLLSLCLVFSLAACNNSEDMSGNSSADNADNASAFEKPENYSAVLLASINPQIKLYLADDGMVSAVEAVNEDAKKIVDEVMAENADYQAVIKTFISVANSKGFIKDGAKIEFEIVEAKDEKTDTKDILSKASAAAEIAADELEISLEVVAVGAEDTSGTDSDDETTGTASDDDTTQTETHTHSYSKATCTEPEKCSCGATNGAALGHSWKSATCETPKTCKTCDATEGDKGDHSYSDGTCTVCGITTSLNPKTELKTYVEYIGNLQASGDMLYGAALQFEDGVCVVVSREFSTHKNDPNQTPIVFNGTEYYSMGGGQDPHNFELTDSEIIIKGSIWGENPDTVTLKLTLQRNGMLKVTYSINSQFPVGTILSANINDVLK